MITQKYLKDNFLYTEDGNFIRLKSNKKVVCNKTKHQRYLRITIDNVAYALHRVIFCYHYGYLPKTIDHIDGDRYNNKIENLREVTQQENCLNRKHKSTSSSPYKNVYLQSVEKGKTWKRNWVVSLTVNGKRKYIGSFQDIELANLVAIEAREKYHKHFSCHG